MRYTVILTDEVKGKLHALPIALRREIGHKLFLLEEDLSGNVKKSERVPSRVSSARRRIPRAI